MNTAPRRGGWLAMVALLLISLKTDAAAGYRMQIAFAGHTNRTENLTNFPALVVFSNGMGGTDFNFGRSPFLSLNGYDLRFWDATETVPLNYEIDQWSTNGPCSVWVQVPLLASNGTTCLWATWGDTNNATQAPCTTNGATWSEGFAAVWHLANTNLSSAFPDSAGYGRNGANTGATSLTGAVDGGQSFNGSSSRIMVPYSSVFDLVASFAIEGWFSIGSGNIAGQPGLISKESSQTDRNWILWIGNLTGDGGSVCWKSSAGLNFATPSTYNDGLWHHVAAVHDGTRARLYVDGFERTNVTAGAQATQSQPVYIGCETASAKWYRGGLDEFRIARTARSSDWVWAAWMTVASNTVFSAYTMSGLPTVSNDGGASNVNPLAGTADLNGFLTAAGGGPMEVWVSWGTNPAWWDNTRDLGTPGAGLLTASVSELQPDQTYYYQFAASNAFGASWAAATSVFITGEVNLRASIPNAAEDGPVNGEFEVWRPASASAEALMVSYVVSGSAGNGTDYSNLTGVVTIPAGITNASIPVNVIDDSVWNEGAETVSLTLANGPYGVGPQNSASVAIADNDVLPVGPFRMKITFSGYTNRTENLTNFPALVVFRNGMGGTDFTYAKYPFLRSDGYDLRFYDATETTLLPYEVEQWNTNGASTVWVRVPSIATNTDCIWAKWYDPNFTNQEAYTTNGAVWSDGFWGVWHLSRINGFDSTLRHNPASPAGPLANADSGMADGAVSFGPGSQIALANPAFTNNAVCLEAWVKHTNALAASPQEYLRLHSGSAGTRRAAIRYDGNNLAGFDIKTGTAANDRNITASLSTVGAWYYVVGTWDGSYMRLYTNATSAASSGPIAEELVKNADAAYISFNGQGSPMNGLIDEVRVSWVARSADWIWASYMTVASNATFSSYGNVGALSPTIENRPASGVSADSATLNGYLRGTSPAPTGVWALLGTNNLGATTNGWWRNYTFGPQEAGALSTNVTGLAPDTTYYYRFYATNAAGTGFASTNMVFITGEVSLRASIPDAAEDGPVNGEFEVWRPVSASAEALTVYYTISGSASNGVDYSNLTGVVTIPAGATNATIPVNVLNDGAWNEKPETVTLTLAAGSYAVGAQNTATVTNTPWPVLRIAQADLHGSEVELAVTGLVANTQYAIQAAHDLLVAAWSNVAFFNAAGKSTNWMQSLPPGDGPPVFYRVAVGGPGDWPQWGGQNNRNMASDQVNLPNSFSVPSNLNSGTNWNMSTATNVKWIVALGGSTFGSPAVSAGKVVVGTTALMGDTKYTGDRGTLLCLDETTGQRLWRLSSPRNPANRNLTGSGTIGISSGPTIEGDRVYFIGNQCDVLCADMKGLADGNDGPFTNEASYFAGSGNPPVALGADDGDIVWRFDILQRLGIDPHDACSSSPLVCGDLLYVGTGNGVNQGHAVSDTPKAPSLIVLNKNTGELVAQDDEQICTSVFHGSWSSPSLGTVNGQPLILYGGANGFCYAFNPTPVAYPGRTTQTLQKVWWFNANYQSGSSASEIIATPVCWSNRVYVAVGQDWTHGNSGGQLVCMDATQTGDITVSGRIWAYKQISKSVATCSVADGLVYAADQAGKVHCLDAMTGATNWVFSGGAAFWGSTLAADGKVYAANSGGLFYILAGGRVQSTLFPIALSQPFSGSIIAADNTVFFANYTRLFALRLPQD